MEKINFKKISPTKKKHTHMNNVGFLLSFSFFFFYFFEKLDNFKEKNNE